MTATDLIPWAEIRRDFVETWPRPSLRALAEQHDVSYTAIRRVARRERWRAQAERARLGRVTARFATGQAGAVKAARVSVARVLRLLRAKPKPEALRLAAQRATSDLGSLTYYAANLADLHAEAARLSSRSAA